MSTYTVCFSGTACTRDEGEATRPNSDQRIYCRETGYIPVRLHTEISGDLQSTSPSVTIRGIGENDWATPRDSSEPLTLTSPLKASDSLLSYVKRYSGGDQRGRGKELTGWAAPALALHAANLAAESGAQTYNFIGHSRGAVESIMAAWFLYAYGPRDVDVNIFAIDPVPGSGAWYGILTQLPPNVAEYAGVYAWDHLDVGFNALVPRPNGQMMGKPNDAKLRTESILSDWRNIADDCQLVDPLAPDGNRPQPTSYALYVCRGRHGTVAGNTTGDGYYDPNNVDASVAPVPQLVYRAARAYLTKWGTQFLTPGAVDASAMELRRMMHTDHMRFDAMGGGATRNSRTVPRNLRVREISATSGRNPFATSYFEDVVGDPPYTLAYPVTVDRANAGWVKWKFL
jgi:hypothetical protein